MDFKVNYPNFINARECFSFTLSSVLNALEDSFSQILLKKKCTILWIRIKSKHLLPNHFLQSRLILPIIIGEKDLKYSIRYESIMNPIFCTVKLENFMMSCRDKLYHRTISNKIKFNFLIKHLIRQNVLQEISSFVWHWVRNRKNDFDKFCW